MKSTYCINNYDLHDVNTFTEATVVMFTGPAPFENWTTLSVLPKDIDWELAEKINGMIESGADGEIFNFVQDPTDDNGIAMTQAIIRKYLDHLKSN